MEKERSCGVGEEGLDGNLLYTPYITHTEQQTDEFGCNLDQILHENQALKKELELHQFRMSFIQGDNKHSTFYTGLSWEVVLHLYQFLSPVVDPSQALEKEDEFFFIACKAPARDPCGGLSLSVRHL